jgi:restriction system protein
MARGTAKGPKFILYFGPLVEALKQLGGSGRPEEVKDIIIENLKISDDEQNDVTESGVPRFSNKVDWARFYLARDGYLDASVRGVWSLTEKGRQVGPISHTDALAIFKEVRRLLELEKTLPTAEIAPSTKTEDNAEEKVTPQTIDYRAELLAVLKVLSPSGFERLCQRLLRESGFERVTITGRSGDGGIDGIGILQMTPFVSFKVLFQCKKYNDSVNASQVRDFRGAMMGRADKGIIMTTGTFTKDARAEAVRDGVPPIELVDSEKLLDLFESLELGLKPRKTYDVNHEFFEEFK